MLASFKSVLRIAAYPFAQERYIFFASILLLAGLALIAGSDDPLPGGPMVGAALGWVWIMWDHEGREEPLLVGRSEPEGSDIGRRPK